MYTAYNLQNLIHESKNYEKRISEIISAAKMKMKIFTNKDIDNCKIYLTTSQLRVIIPMKIIFDPEDINTIFQFYSLNRKHFNKILRNCFSELFTSLVSVNIYFNSLEFTADYIFLNSTNEGTSFEILCVSNELSRRSNFQQNYNNNKYTYIINNISKPIKKSKSIIPDKEIMMSYKLIKFINNCIKTFKENPTELTDNYSFSIINNDTYTKSKLKLSFCVDQSFIQDYSITDLEYIIMKSICYNKLYCETNIKYTINKNIQIDLIFDI